MDSEKLEIETKLNHYRAELRKGVEKCSHSQRRCPINEQYILGKVVGSVYIFMEQIKGGGKTENVGKLC